MGGPHELSVAKPGSTVERLLTWAQKRPRPAYSVVAVVAAVIGGTVGPVMALLAAGYCSYGLSIVLKTRRARLVAKLRDRARHEVELLATDVRAGTAPPTAMLALAAAIGESGDRATVKIGERLRALASVIEATGAPAADLLDRLVADLNVAARTESTLAANTAGIRASAGMLALLPLTGPIVGMAIGADPLSVLLETPIGLVCLAAAIAFQSVGLLWSSRIRQAVEAQAVTS
ncbi:tight adherence protein B [Stackebrandtia endophytica]|uniref:Tight adherence protein B n=2 Tax=Stackebrandtia endophytica TaxID=1496996 RepID=A0A543AYA9_9ACTN|nr:tight adherence protein B [Stackebrandtia endophytica]